MKKVRVFGAFKSKDRQPPFDATSRFLEICKKAVVISLLLYGFIVVVWNMKGIAPYFWQWIGTISHFEGFGFKFDRRNAEDNVRKLEHKLQGSNELTINATFALAAIARASNAPQAITGSRIMWVDSNWENNTIEQAILEDMGIDVYRFSNNDEAIRSIPIIRPDLIISNVSRKNEPSSQLRTCPAHYYALPVWANMPLDVLNKGIISGTVPNAAGFSLAEKIANMPSEFRSLASPEAPRIIFYSARSGEISASKCARLVTNRADVLLNSVVSILEEWHWRRLDSARRSETIQCKNGCE
jgi:CheY-like chemotaxis protein